MARILIPWKQIEKLGGPVEGDPPNFWRAPESHYCAENKNATLPESGAFVLRMLWRHLAKNERQPYEGVWSLGVMDTPDLVKRSLDGEWLLRHHNLVRDEHEFLPYRDADSLGHGHITDPCEALAAIVKVEAGKYLGGHRV